LIEAESFSGEWHFVIPGQRGRLHINWHHGQSPPRGKASEAPAVESIRLNLTARGPIPPSERSGDALLDGLNLGHETIVRSFAGLMSEPANRLWGLK
jgi:hypothetical protein